MTSHLSQLQQQHHWHQMMLLRQQARLRQIPLDASLMQKFPKPYFQNDIKGVVPQINNKHLQFKMNMQRPPIEFQWWSPLQQVHQPHFPIYNPLNVSPYSLDMHQRHFPQRQLFNLEEKHNLLAQKQQQQQKQQNISDQFKRIDIPIIKVGYCACVHLCVCVCVYLFVCVFYNLFLLFLNVFCTKSFINSVIFLY